MRIFNEREKKIINQLVENYSNEGVSTYSFLRECYFTADSPDGFVLDNKKPKAYYFRSIELIGDSKLQAERRRCFYELLALMSYLKEYRYINIFPLPDIYKESTIFFKQGWDRDWEREDEEDGKIFLDNGLYLKNKNGVEIYDSDNKEAFISAHLPEGILNLFKELLGDIIVTEDLIEYVNNGFTTPEERRYKKQVRLTWISIAVALLIGLLGIFL